MKIDENYLEDMESAGEEEKVIMITPIPVDGKELDLLLSQYYHDITWKTRISYFNQCPVCGKKKKIVDSLKNYLQPCNDCLQSMESRKETIFQLLGEKALKGERFGSNEIPFFLSLSDKEKYDFILQFFSENDKIGLKSSYDLIISMINFLNLHTDSDYFIENFYPHILKKFTFPPHLLPAWCGSYPKRMPSLKPGEIVHYIDHVLVHLMKDVKENYENEKELNHKMNEKVIFDGICAITSERLLFISEKGDKQKYLPIKRFNSLSIFPTGVDFKIDGSMKRYRIICKNSIRAENLQFCLNHLIL